MDAQASAAQRYSTDSAQWASRTNTMQQNITSLEQRSSDYQKQMDSFRTASANYQKRWDNLQSTSTLSLAASTSASLSNACLPFALSVELPELNNIFSGRFT